MTSMIVVPQKYREHIQELKAVNAEESAALAQAFVSKAFLEVQVCKKKVFPPGLLLFSPTCGVKSN